MRAVFYKFNKKVSSTAQPSGEGTPFEIVLKNNISISAPCIELSSAALDYNYCYIPTFNRFYWVHTPIIMTADLISYTLSVDVLATYQDDIKNAYLYVKRSASKYDVNLPDSCVTHTTNFYENAVTSSLSGFSSTGCYIIQVVNGSGVQTANPGSTMYAISPGYFSNLLKDMFASVSYDGLDSVQMTYFNPFQYITSARWIPFSASSVGGSKVSKIQYGWYEADCEAYYVTDYGKTLTNTLQIGAYNDWTDRSSEWTQYTLYVPGCGVMSLDAAFSGQTLTCKMFIDYNNGTCNFIATTGENQIALQSTGKIGCDVAINQVAINPNIPTSVGEVATSVAKSSQGWFNSASKAMDGLLQAYGAATNRWEAGGLSGATADAFNVGMQQAIEGGKETASAIADGLMQTFLNPTVSSSGADGARYTITQMHSYILYKRKYNVFAPSVYTFAGRPCESAHTLGELSGYCVCANGQIETNATMEERNLITNFLESGVWLEW